MKKLFNLWAQIEAQLVLALLYFILLSWPILMESIYSPFQVFVSVYSIWLVLIIPQFLLSWFQKSADKSHSQSTSAIDKNDRSDKEDV